MASLHPVSAEHDPLLVNHIPAAKIPAVLRLLNHRDVLLNHRDDVLELCSVDPRELEAYFQVALISRKNAIDNRQSTDTLSTFRSSGVSSIFSSQPDSRASLVSDVTNLSRTSSTSSRLPHRPTQHGNLPSSLPIQSNGPSGFAAPTVQPSSRNLLRKEKRYKCHVCVGTGAKRPNDFLKHMKGFCEKPEKRYKCLECDVIEKEDAEIQSHGLLYQHRYQPDPFELPPKVAFGCPFCGSLQPSLDAYARCICKDQDADSTLRAVPLRRLRGLLQQDIIKEALALACQRRDLDHDAWTFFTWDDQVIAEFAEILEYGCNGSDAYRGLGVVDLDAFVDKLLASARFECSNRPAPPVKDFVEAHARALLLEDRNETAADYVPADPQPVQEVQFYMSDYLRLRSSDPELANTQRGVKELTATTLQGPHDHDSNHYPLWKQLPKRPPSTSSSSMKDGRSRSKRPAAASAIDDAELFATPAPPLANDAHFPFESDSAMCHFHAAIYESRGIQAPMQCDIQPTEGEAIPFQTVSTATLNDDDFDSIFDNDFYDSYGLDGMT